jgi:hypothetical protein
MNAEVSRRVFVGSVAAGLPLLAQGGSASFAKAGVAAHNHATGDGSADPVLEHVARQVAAIHNKTKERGITSEDARAIAAHLRTVDVYGRQINMNEQTKQAARKFFEAKGREAALYLDTDRRAAREELKRHGVDADDRWLETSGVDYLTRVQSRDDLLRTGLSGVLARAATTFDTIAAELDRRGVGQTAKVVRVQTWYDGYCAQIQREIMRLEMDAGFVCAFGAYYGALTSVCLMIGAAISVQLAAYFLYC